MIREGGLARKRETKRGKLGLWREKARWHRKKNLKRNFTVRIHQIL